MKGRGPLITLVAGGAVAATLVVMSSSPTIAVLSSGQSAVQSASPAAAAKNSDRKAAPAVSQTQAPRDSASPSAEQAADDTPRRASYVGLVAAPGIPIAIAVRDGKAVAYVCDGVRTEAWLWGTAKSGKIKLSSKDGKARLAGSIDAASTWGRFWLGAKKWDYRAKYAKKPSGLYRATAQVRGKLYQASWIIDGSGKQTGLLDAGGLAGRALKRVGELAARSPK